MIGFIKELMPLDTFRLLVHAFGLQFLSYYLTKFVHRKPKAAPKIKLDDKIRQIPAWTIVYVMAFVQWVVCYYITFRFGTVEKTYMLFADTVSKIVCMLFFAFMPVTIERPVPSGRFAWLLKFIYKCDKPTNLFPSMHCLLSFLSCAAVATIGVIPLGVRIANCVFSLFVYASTLFTKQHVFNDVLAGIVLGVVTYSLALIIF